MADLSLVFDLLAKDRASSEVSKVGKSFDEAGGHASGFGDKVKGMFGAVAALAGGAGLAVGATFFGALDQQAGQNKLAAQLGLSPAESAKAGKLAGDLYAQNYGDSLESVNEAVRAVAANITSDINSPDMSELTAKALDLAQVFGVDVADSTKAVSNLIETGLVQNASEAMDVVTAGFQGGNDAAGDWLDTLNEYSVQFQKLGIDGKTATNLISQGMQAGARDSDLVADAIKEFSIRAVDGSKTTAAGFEAIGLSAGDTAKAIGAGGTTASTALQQVFEHLRAIKDPVAQAQAATALFGTQAEDLGTALYQLDPASAGAAASVANMGGAADRLDTTIGQGLGPTLEKLKRGAQQLATEGMNAVIAGFTDGSTKAGGWQGKLQNAAAFVKSDVIPALKGMGEWLQRNSGTIRVVAGVIGGVLVPVLASWGVASIVNSAKSVVAWLTTAFAASGSAAAQERSAAQVGLSWVAMGAKAVFQGIKIAAVWTAQIVASAVSGAASFAVQVARVVAGWVLMGVQSMIRAVQMAAAWVIAMGPVGWIIAIVIGLVALIIANWDKVKAWTVRAFNAVWGFLKGIWASIVGAFKAALAWVVNLFLNWTLIGLIIKHWSAIKGAFTKGISAVVGFMKGLPGKILSALAGFGRLLLKLGGDLLHGLWEGISGAGKWLLDKVGKFFGDLLPGWVKDILGISSPSKVFAAFGRESMRGFAAGIDEGAAVAVGAAGRAAAAVTAASGVDLGGRLGTGRLGYRPPGYDMGGPGGAGLGGNTYLTTVAGVASPEAVAAAVDRAQRTNEFLAGVGS